MRVLPFVLATLVAGTALVLPASAGQWTVARDGSGHFTEIQQAVDVGQGGDVIWVLPGVYGDVVVQQKALHVLGAGAGSTFVDSVRIDSMPGGMTCFAGLSIGGETVASANLGTVVLRDCAAQELSLAGCERVYVENWHGTRATSEVVGALWVSTSQFQGAAGLDAVWGGDPFVWDQLPTPGQSAFTARATTLLATRSDFLGGAGGNGSCISLVGLLAGEEGGSGLVDAGGDSTFWLADCSFAAGTGGKGGILCQLGGTPAALITALTTDLHWDEDGANLYPMSIQVPTQVGAYSAIDFWGQPGDSILLLTATSPAAGLVTDAPGFPLGLDLNTGFVNFWPLTRTIQQDGHVTWTHIIPNEPLLAGLVLFEQALLVDAPGGPAHPPLLTSVSSTIIEG